MESKVTEQRQGKYRRYVIHIPDEVVKTINYNPLYFEWVIGDNDHVELWAHSRNPPGGKLTKVTTNRGPSGISHYRLNIPSNIVGLMEMRGATVEWQMKTTKIYVLTVLRTSAGR